MYDTEHKEATYSFSSLAVSLLLISPAISTGDKPHLLSIFTASLAPGKLNK